MMNEGDRIPDLTLPVSGPASNGGSIRLRDFEGAPFVLYFYPKDDTPGCTREAQDFSAALPGFAQAGAKVLGVSKDTSARHAKFIAKYDLTVPLASDDQDAATAAFGTWVEKQLYGKTYMGIDRSTFLFGADGRLVRSWRTVRVPGHVEQVLEAVRELAA